MDNEKEYRDLCLIFRSSPEELETLVRLFEIKKQKLLLQVENSDNKDILWDIKVRLSCLEEFKREIITHSKA